MGAIFFICSVGSVNTVQIWNCLKDVFSIGRRFGRVYFAARFLNVTANARPIITSIIGRMMSGNSVMFGVEVAAVEGVAVGLDEVAVTVGDAVVVEIGLTVGVAREAGEFKAMTTLWLLW